MNEIDTAKVKSNLVPRSELTREERAIYRLIWEIVGQFHKPGQSWEEFEFVSTCNNGQHVDIHFFAYVCARFTAYRAANPKCGTCKLRRVYLSIAEEYNRLNPYVMVHHHDGTSELKIMKGFRPPTRAAQDAAQKLIVEWFDENQATIDTLMESMAD